MELTPLKLRHLGLQSYEPIWQQMRDFTDSRQADSADEFWLLEHESVFTLGQAGKEAHLLSVKEIPVVRTDRGGQVTYHGPGQLMLYCLIDLKRKGVGVRSLVSIMEAAIIELLQGYNIKAEIKQGAPGVYVNGAKIASLGLRVRKGCSYHGLALNINADLEPFHQINPCGYPGLEMVNMQALHKDKLSLAAVSDELVNILVAKLAFQKTTQKKVDAL